MTTSSSHATALPRLVFIPGLAADAAMWQAQLAAMPADLHPVVTTAHAQPSALRIEDMAAQVLAFHGGPLLLCGASMGGMVAMEAARQAPGRVAGLALLGTSARPEAPEMRALREAAMELFAQGRVREVIEPNVAFAFHPASAAKPHLVQAYLDFVLRAGAEQLVRQNRAVIHRPDARLHLPRIACPTLVVCGDADQLTPPECSAEIAALIPGADYQVLAECGHMLTMEQPDAVNRALLGWLARGGWAR
ncbi:alpha/beta hydrolase [Acidovorax sp. Leaf76]|uniref:alpha/beta fold hydrolase n=1 Tax=unclassified Acidovorax TaxID=2684926 RepID=UPI0006F37B46|nr:MULTISPECIES: alpha/beta fold hydrolase [unclassified Acidovorax]KQO16435.1 alpha/beta hydrolase [Acidovorax sp. Leaf76]KQO32501.1 alpha/beta hydrolase [Acidovorax sp. Leaf84]KQS32069.1 alpha/beta hydrolase [Acidovorax sp. Leaf191]